MGHNIKLRDYPLSVNRKEVQAGWNNYAAHEDWQEGCSGVSPIRWLDSEPICESYEEAEHRIEQLDKGWYDCLAVRYYETPPQTTTATLDRASVAVNNAQKAYNELKDKADRDFYNLESEYVGCKGCGSRLKRNLLRHSYCPLCGESLLSKTMQDRIAKSHDRLQSTQKKQKEEQEKAQKRAAKAIKNREVRWLVKIEYHT